LAIFAVSVSGIGIGKKLVEIADTFEIASKEFDRAKNAV
jgi:hypothetical protein